MTTLAIATLKKTLKYLEQHRDELKNSIGYHEKELMTCRTQLADKEEQIKGLTATIELLEKV